MRVQIAFDLAANGIGDFFTLDDTTKGVLDGATYLLAGDVLVDVTSDVRAVQVRRGRSRTLEKFTAGNANLVLDNRDRAYDPLNGPIIGGTRTNLYTNPSFEVDTAGWGFNSASAGVRSTAQSYAGSAALLLTANGGANFGAFVSTRLPVTAGLAYTGSAYVRDINTANQYRLIFEWYDSGGTFISNSVGPNTSVTSASWTRVSYTATAPVGATSAFVSVYSAGLPASSTQAYFDAYLCEQSSTLGAYFDGSYADPSISVNSKSWTGTAHSSTSTLVWNSYAGSPYYGSIVPRKEVRIDVDGNYLFTGNIEDWNFSYSLSEDSTAEPSCVDGMAWIASRTLPAGTATSQATGARVGAVLDLISWPAPTRAISTGQATLAADVRADDVNALDYLNTVALSDPGAFFVSKEGMATFRDRADLQTLNDSGVIFGTGGIPFTGIEVVYGTEEMTNQANVVWSAGTAVGGTAVGNDLTAQAAYGVMDATYTTLLSSATQAEDLADWLVGQYGQPRYRVDRLQVRLDGLTGTQVNDVLGLELGDAVQVIWTPNSMGSAVSQYVSIDGIEHSATPAMHDVTFTLSQTQAAFLLDSSSLGVLDTNALGF